MTDDDVVIGCFRVRDLPVPHPESVTHACEHEGCSELIWVHPNSFAIALAEHGKLICIDHLADFPDAHYAVHPLQQSGLEQTLREQGLL